MYKRQEIDSLTQALTERLEAKGNNMGVKEVFVIVDSLKNLNEQISYQNTDSIILANPMGHFKSLEKHSFFKRVIDKQRFFRTLAEQRNIYEFKDLGDSIPIVDSYENKMTFSSGQSMRKLIRQPGTYVQSIFTKLPFLIFFFLPVFALAIWLMYTRKKFTYVDHLIFSFHNQSLLFILLIISFLIDAIFDTVSQPIFLLIFLFYLYKAMRKFYQQKRFKTIVKYLLLNTIFVILATVSVTFLVLGTAFTY